MMMDRVQGLLLIVDVQDKLVGAMEGAEWIISRISLLMDGATILGVPIVISEQYPKGLGATVPAIAERAPQIKILEKLDFSCVAEPALSNSIQATGRRQIVLCGIEAHICILQTALELYLSDYDVFVVADAIASRRGKDHETALDRLSQAGVTIVTVEMVLFEWLRRAGTAEFKAISQLMR